MHEVLLQVRMLFQIRIVQLHIFNTSKDVMPICASIQSPPRPPSLPQMDLLVWHETRDRTAPPPSCRVQPTRPTPTSANPSRTRASLPWRPSVTPQTQEASKAASGEAGVSPEASLAVLNDALAIPSSSLIDSDPIAQRSRPTFRSASAQAKALVSRAPLHHPPRRTPLHMDSPPGSPSYLSEADFHLMRELSS